MEALGLKAACLKCGKNDRGTLNCCSRGGSWEGSCTNSLSDFGLHSWEEGFAACRDERRAAAPKPAGGAAAAEGDGSHPKNSAWSNLKALNDLFSGGQPSNDLTKVGLTVHCFDDTEKYAALFRPCDAGWCVKSSKWWSASIINAKQRSTFGNSGLIFTPSRNKLLCSFPADTGTMYSGCSGGDMMFAPNNTEGMLHWSMGNAGRNLYNEVLIDSKYFVENLPGSVAAFVYGLRDGEEFDKVKAVQAYVQFLDAFKLKEGALPLLRAKLPMSNSDVLHQGTLFVDESHSARAFLKTHPYAEHLKRWRDAHPFLTDHPERTHDVLASRHGTATWEQWEQRAEAIPGPKPSLGGESFQHYQRVNSSIGEMLIQRER